MDKKLLLVLGVLAVFGVFIFLRPSDSVDENASVDEITDSVIDEESETSEDMTEMEAVMKVILGDAATVSAELPDVTGGTSSGTAYISRTNGKFYHYVEASLPEPAEGSVYEGWLVIREPELQFFSTGVMEMREDGMYVLSYIGDEVSEEYNFVVITEETVVDETPETHIIEGVVG